MKSSLFWRICSLLLLFLLIISTASSLADSMLLGTWEQDGDTSNGREPIEWLILDEKDGSLFLLSRYALDCQRYNLKYNNNTTYETSTVRTFLNETFYGSAFSEEEKDRILLTLNQQPRKRNYKSKSGNDTEDYVFLLSFEELETYLPTKKDRICEPTPYTKAQGVRVKRGACPWWLRTPGQKQHHACTVTIDGGYYDYFDISCPTNGIRPALWVRKE